MILLWVQRHRSWCLFFRSWRRCTAWGGRRGPPQGGGGSRACEATAATLEGVRASPPKYSAPREHQGTLIYGGLYLVSYVAVAGFAPARFTEADYSRHLRGLEEKVPAEAFTVVLEPPFVVIGDEPALTVKRRATETVK